MLHAVHSDLAGNLFSRQGGTWTPISGHATAAPNSQLHLVHLADTSPASLCIHVLGKFVKPSDGATEVASIGTLYADEAASPIAFYTRDERGKLTPYSF
jgi:hypothetical protein